MVVDDYDLWKKKLLGIGCHQRSCCLFDDTVVIGFRGFSVSHLSSCFAITSSGVAAVHTILARPTCYQIVNHRVHLSMTLSFSTINESSIDTHFESSL